MKTFLRSRILILVFFFVFSYPTFAANPSQPFLPSDNVQDPNCTPLDSNCYVSTVSATTTLQQGGNSFGTTLTLGTNDNQALSFETNGASAMTILGNGNVGVGTSTPGSTFHIVNSNPVITLQDTDFGISVWQIRNGAQSNTLDFYEVQRDKVLMSFTTDQVRIGTSTNDLGNSSRLFVYGGAQGANIDVRGEGVIGRDQALLDLQASDWTTSLSSTYLAQYGPEALGTTFGMDNEYLGKLVFSGIGVIETTSFTDPIVFGTGLEERMRLTSNGYLGIGTTTPADKLQVFGDIRVGTTGTNGCIKDFGGTGITGTCSSDERLKTNVVDLSDGYLDKMNNLRLITYNWNEQANSLNKVDTTNTNYGLLAQNVESIFPELVTVDSNGFKQVNYSRLPLYLLKAVQELSKKVSSFADSITTKELKTDKLCVEDVCVTKEQFKAMLQNSNVTPTVYQPPTPPVPEPVIEEVSSTTPVVVPEPTPIVPTPEIVPEPIVEPTPEVVVVETPIE